MYGPDSRPCRKQLMRIWKSYRESTRLTTSNTITATMYWDNITGGLQWCGHLLLSEDLELFTKISYSLQKCVKKWGLQWKKGNRKITLQQEQEERTDRISLSDTGIPGSDLDQLSSHTCSICIKSVWLERHYEAGIYRACQFPAYFYERYLFLGFYQSNCMVCFSGGDRCRGILTDHSDPLKHEYKRPDIVPLPVLHPVSAAGYRRI